MEVIDLSEVCKKSPLSEVELAKKIILFLAYKAEVTGDKQTVALVTKGEQ